MEISHQHALTCHSLTRRRVLELLPLLSLGFPLRLLGSFEFFFRGKDLRLLLLSLLSLDEVYKVVNMSSEAPFTYQEYLLKRTTARCVVRWAGHLGPYFAIDLWGEEGRRGRKGICMV